MHVHDLQHLLPRSIAPTYLPPLNLVHARHGNNDPSHSPNLILQRSPMHGKFLMPTPNHAAPPNAQTNLTAHSPPGFESSLDAQLDVFH